MAYSVDHSPAAGITPAAQTKVSALQPVNESSFSNTVNKLWGYNPKKYSGKLLKKLYATCFLPQISNTDYEGEIKDFGDTVVIRTTPDIQVKEWKKGADLTYTTYETDCIELVINRGKYWAFPTDPLDKVQTDIKSFVDGWTTEAAKRIALAIEEDFLGYLATYDSVTTNTFTNIAAANQGNSAGATSGDIALGTKASPVVLTNQNVIAKINDCGQVLAEQNLPTDTDNDFWMLVDPKVANMLGNSELKLSWAMGDGKSLELKGGQHKIPKLDCFNIYRSNILPKVKDAGQSYRYVLFGHKSAVTFASQLTQNEVLPNPNAFGMLHRGLTVYGFKVIYPKYVGIMVISYGANNAAPKTTIEGDVAIVNSATAGKTTIATTVGGDVAVVNSSTDGKTTIATAPANTSTAPLYTQTVTE